LFPILSSSSSSFLNDRLEQTDLGNYKTDLHQIFRDGIVGVVVQSGTGFWIGQGTLPWQLILGAKLATPLPSWDLHSTMDGSREKRMGMLTA